MSISKIFSLRNYVMKQIMKTNKEGIMQIPNKNKVDFGEMIIRENLFRKGIDPKTITNEQQLDNILNTPTVSPKPMPKKSIGELFGFKNYPKKSGEVIDVDFGKPFAKEIESMEDIADKKLIEQMYRTAGPRNLDEDAGYLAEFIVEDAGKFLDDLPKTEQNKFIERAKNALRKNVKKYQPVDFGKPKKAKGIEEIREKNKNYKLNLFKNLDDNKKLNADEMEELGEELSFNINDPDGPSLYEVYPDFDGTAGSAKKILRQDAEYEQSMFEQYKAGKLDPTPKPVGSLDREIKESYNQAVREGKFNNVRLKDGRRIESEDDFREYIDELNEDNNFADGGVAGLLGERQNFAMGRRAFLKLMGGVGAGIGALKTGALKLLGKEGAKNISQVVTTPPTPGKPAWFDKLVNKVILEGDDITKKFATKEREIVHIKKIDEDNTVTVTQDLDEGIVRVEYDSPTNMYEDTVQLQYKKPLPDEFNPNPKAEFSTAESGPVGKSVGPDDYDIEVDEIGGASIEDLSSDVSKLKEFATGKKPTMKEIIQNKKRKDKVKKITNDPEAESEEVVRRQGDYVDDNAYQYDDPGAEGFASGGRVPLAGGGGGFAFKLAKRYRQSKQYKDFIEKLFVKTSNEIRRGEGAFKNLSVNEKIKLHDDLTKEVTNYQKTGELPESAHQYFGFNPEQQYADSLLQKQLKMTPEEELRQEFPGITDEMVSNILTDTNQQRIAEVKATMKEALKMQEKGMGTDEILQTFEKTPRTKNASGGIARLLGE